MPPLTALLVGDAQRSEFREAVATLDGCSRLVVAPDVAAAEWLLAEDLAADLIVVAQAFPGQFTTAAVERLRRHAPLARVVGLLGSWCEGEVRTGQPWPAVVRVYWHQWPARCRRELEALAAGHCSPWALPSTASEEEHVLAEAPPPAGRCRGRVAIAAWQFDVQDWLAAACRRLGYTTVWLRAGQPGATQEFDALLYDCGGDVATELRELERWRQLLGPIPTLALVNYPRVEDREQLRAAGVSRMLSKPLGLADLSDEMAALLGP